MDVTHRGCSSRLCLLRPSCGLPPLPEADGCELRSAAPPHTLRSRISTLCTCLSPGHAPCNSPQVNRSERTTLPVKTFKIRPLFARQWDMKPRCVYMSHNDYSEQMYEIIAPALLYSIVLVTRSV